jgi:hypothetical protein
MMIYCQRWCVRKISFEEKYAREKKRQRRGEWFENENRARSARGDGEKPPTSLEPGEERFVAKKSTHFVRGVAKTLPVRALETDEKRGVDESF